MCVVDISGSMGAEASVKTDSGKEEKHGLSLLDIVKHAVKTVVHTLQPTDRFALVVFSTTARVVLDLTYIKDTPKQRIFSKVLIFLVNNGRDHLPRNRSIVWNLKILLIYGMVS